MLGIMLSVCVCVCRISLSNEGNVLYPVLSSFWFVIHRCDLGGAVSRNVSVLALCILRVATNLENLEYSGISLRKFSGNRCWLGKQDHYYPWRRSLLNLLFVAITYGKVSLWFWKSLETQGFFLLLCGYPDTALMGQIANVGSKSWRNRMVALPRSGCCHGELKEMRNSN